jgi:diguanylate cyclase (GGDEF)-like protein
MNADQPQQILSNLDDWQRVQRPRELMRFTPVVPLSTAGGCLLIALYLWPVSARGGSSAWLAAGLALSLAQWWSQRLVGRTRQRKTPGRDPLERRRWIAANALAAGTFWGITTVVLAPASVEQQLLLAFILMTITALWLPLFALSPLSLLVFTVPGLLPMAFGLLTSPEPPRTTMGSLLLLLIGVFAATVQATSRIFFADLAARRALYHQATHDCLVGLANRAEFHRRVQTLEIMRALPYAILFIDLDHFKEVNDSAGHAAGDELLRRVGTVLRESVRSGDLAARLGGDEFAILMEDCGAPDALHVAATILERINTFALTCDGQRRRVTASIGVACSADLCSSPGRLIEAADQACYAAKRAGRNRIEIATGSSGSPARAAGRASFAQISDVAV